MAYIGAGITRFNTADELTVTGDAQIDTTTLVVDSTNNRVGIGIAAPSEELEISGTGVQTLKVDRTDASTAGALTINSANGSNYIYNLTAKKLIFGTNNTSGLTIDENNKIGIGTTTPAHNVEIVATAAGSVNDSLQIRNNATSSSTGSRIRFINSTDANSDANGASIASVRNGNDNDLVFETENSEAMRIDHSGNLLVGKTSNDSTTVGANIRADKSFFTSSGQEALVLNRNTSDGTILELRKANGTVGSIGTSSSRLHIENGDTGLRIAGDLDQIFPCGSGGGDRDAAIDLGSTGVRFKDLYLSGGAYLGGTGSANKLDDYEEIDFSPTVSSGYASVSHTKNTGRATKIGRLVVGHIELAFSSSSRNSDQVMISGLPFTSTNSSGHASMGGVITYQVNFSSNFNQVFIGNNSTLIQFHELDGSSLTGSETSGPNNVQIRLAFSYVTD